MCDKYHERHLVDIDMCIGIVRYEMLLNLSYSTLSLSFQIRWPA